MAKRSDESLLELPEVSLPKRVPPLTKVSEADISSMPLGALIAEAHALKEAEKRMKACKEKIREIILEEYGTGVRCAGLCAMVRFQDGRVSLDREKLIDAGITPAQLRSGEKRGEPFYVVEFPVMEGL